MLDDDLARHMARYQQAVMDADAERVDQSWELAYDQLGIPPCYETNTEAHIAYGERLQELARQIFARPN